jgi:DNA repair protein SbcC/Rad50
MRPLLLSFSGIRSYPGKVGPLDFTSKTLIAILGDTGAGKSTLLEAITLALYGNCTWTDREHKALMAEGASQMTVDFTFAHDGQRWRVARAFYANTTPSSHLLQNLDTGEHIDNKWPVNKKIKALLQLDFDSFITAVLLPQGKFDRLLNATGRERTILLKGIFGVQAVEAMRGRAGSHRDQLAELIHQAELARRDLLNDPAAAAQAAGKEACQAEQLAGHLRQALETLRSLRKHAWSARERHARLIDAADALDHCETKDVDGELTRVTESASELAALEAKAARAKQDCEKLRDDAEAQLAAAAREGLTQQSLASAATLLDGVPGRLEELATANAQLDEDAASIARQAQQLETDRTRLRELQALAGERHQAYATANSALQEYREACDRLQDSTRTALRQAANAGQARRDEKHALQRLRDLQEAVLPLHAAADRAAAQLQSADEQLAVVYSHDAAHTAGIGLSAGDPCLICSRPLPDDYQPPAAADPDALQAAERAVKKAKNLVRGADSELAKAQAGTASAQREYDDRQPAARKAQDRLERACDDAAAAMRELARRQPDDRIRPPGQPDFGIMLQAACTRLSESGDDDQDKLLSTAARQLLGPARAVEQALADAAGGADDAARESETDAARAADKLSLAEKAHDDAAGRLTTARKRHAAAQARFGRDLMALPALARDLIPASTPDITPGDIDMAQQIIAGRRGQLDARSQDRERATRELEKLAAARHELDQRRRREITGPLEALATYLERRQDAIEQAVTVLSPHQLRDRMPARPAAVTAEAVSLYAAALAKAEAEARGSVARAEAAARTEAMTQLTELDISASRLRSGRQGSAAIAVAEGEQLLDPAALDPVVAAEASARAAAERHRTDQAAAQDQIQQAASLDTAIRAGRARLSAVEALRGLLGDAKFHQYLTDRRTRALLGVASDIFGRLSGGEFGFAQEFLIISRRSGAARDPKTLSGGETFLASLALALALVELHSRSGARLGALFLDEGFGSLDIDSLASSLAVLQAETGGDKLVAVISHLHAVAEAVEDVMWVERQPDGSSARWLTPAERDALARQEVTSGLLNLI